MHTLSFYRSSGRASPIAWLATVGLVLGGSLLAGIYTALVDWIPYVKATVLVTVAFSFLVGAGVYWTVRFAKVRGQVIAYAIAIASGIAALAASYGWSFFFAVSEYAELEGLDRFEVLADSSIWVWLEARVAAGWTVGKLVHQGTHVYVIWGVEALSVIGGAIWGARSATADPFCERCDEWTKVRSIGLAGLTAADAKPLAERGDVDGLLALQSKTAPEETSVVVSLSRSACPKCDGAAFLSVSEVQYVAAKGGTKEKRKVLLRHATLREDQRQRFDQRFAELAPEEPAAALS